MILKFFNYEASFMFFMIVFFDGRFFMLIINL